MNTQTIKLFLPNDLLLNPTLSGLDLVVHMYINNLSYWSFNGEKYYVTPRFIANEMECDRESFITGVYTSLKNLIKQGVVKGEKVNSYGYLLDVEQFGPYEFEFITINYPELKKIISTDYYYKFELVKFYLLIKYTLRVPVFIGSEKRYISNIAQAFFSNTMDITKQTVHRYVTTLENLNCICVYRSTAPHKNNVYGLYGDEEFVEKYGRKNCSSQPRSEANEQRSLMKKYYWLTQGKTYSPEETAEIKKAVIAHNDRMCMLAEEFPNGGYRSRIKDMSVFN